MPGFFVDKDFKLSYAEGGHFMRKLMHSNGLAGNSSEVGKKSA
jgi:hypothetical protein